MGPGDGVPGPHNAKGGCRTPLLNRKKKRPGRWDPQGGGHAPLFHYNKPSPMGWTLWGLLGPREGDHPHPSNKNINLAPGDGVPGASSRLGEVGRTAPAPLFFNRPRGMGSPGPSCHREGWPHSPSNKNINLALGWGPWGLTHTHAHTCTCIHTCAHTRAHTHTTQTEHRHTQAHVHAHTRAYMHRCTCKHRQVCTHTHTDIHT